MSGSIEQAIKDEKIALLLEDFIALEKKVDELPNRLIESLQSVENAILMMPAQLDEKLADKIDAIVETANTAELNAKEAADSQIADFRVNAESAKNEMLRGFILSINNEMNTAIGKINEAVNEISKITQSKKQSIKPLIAICVLCAFLSLAGGFAGTAVYNKALLDSARLQLRASIKGHEESIKILPLSLAKKVDQIYYESADSELKKRK